MLPPQRPLPPPLLLPPPPLHPALPSALLPTQQAHTNSRTTCGPLETSNYESSSVVVEIPPCTAAPDTFANVSIPTFGGFESTNRPSWEHKFNVKDASLIFGDVATEFQHNEVTVAAKYPANRSLDRLNELPYRGHADSNNSRELELCITHIPTSDTSTQAWASSGLFVEAIDSYPENSTFEDLATKYPIQVITIHEGSPPDVACAEGFTPECPSSDGSSIRNTSVISRDEKESADEPASPLHSLLASTTTGDLRHLGMSVPNSIQSSAANAASEMEAIRGVEIEIEVKNAEEVESCDGTYI
jgi:hypothetical protein